MVHQIRSDPPYTLTTTIVVVPTSSHGRLLDRMEKKGDSGDGGAAGDEKQDDARIAFTAKFKAQKATANR